MGKVVGNLMRRPEAGAFLGVLFVMVFFSAFGNFQILTATGSASWLNVAANLGIIAIPLGLLMIAGELDISIGAMVPAGAMIMGVTSGYFELPVWAGILAALGFGVVVGAINGILVIRTAVPSLIVTLGTLFAVQGLTLGVTVMVTGSTSVALQAPEIYKAIFGDFIGVSLQVIVFWWIAITIVYVFYVHFTKYGNWIFAIGGDRESARNAGIPVSRVTIILFILSATSASFVGLCQTILFNSAQVSSGMTFIFNCIISVVVGGVLLTGGFGSVIGIVFGTITFAVVNQGIYYTPFDRNLSALIIGVMLLIAVLMNNTFRKVAMSYAPSKKKQTSVMPTAKATSEART